jgi:hypothetical protein
MHFAGPFNYSPQLQERKQKLETGNRRRVWQLIPVFCFPPRLFNGGTLSSLVAQTIHLLTTRLLESVKHFGEFQHRAQNALTGNISRVYPPSFRFPCLMCLMNGLVLLLSARRLISTLVNRLPIPTDHW